MRINKGNVYSLLKIIKFLLLLLLSATISAEEPILLYYSERIPYAVLDDNDGVQGLTATPAAKAFEQAGISFQWKTMPFKRQLATLKYNKKKACGIGWFKKPEREAFARFTRAIYQDRPSITISTFGNEKVSHHGTLATLLEDKSIKLLAKDGYSYGAYIDEQIERYSPDSLIVVGSSNIEMLEILLADRADYLFVSEEEAQQILLGSGHEISEFSLNRYGDMPPGNYRYIACSHRVKPATIDKLNRALE